MCSPCGWRIQPPGNLVLALSSLPGPSLTAEPTWMDPGLTMLRGLCISKPAAAVAKAGRVLPSHHFRPRWMRPARRVTMARSTSGAYLLTPERSGVDTASTRQMSQTLPRPGGNRPGLGAGRQLLAWVEDPERVEGVLDSPHDLDGRSMLCPDVRQLPEPDSVLAGRRAARRQGQRDQLRMRGHGGRLRRRVVGREEQREVEVAVAHVTEDVGR